jgi:hypothetical protein
MISSCTLARANDELSEHGAKRWRKKSWEAEPAVQRRYSAAGGGGGLALETSPARIIRGS